MRERCRWAPPGRAHRGCGNGAVRRALLRGQAGPRRDGRQDQRAAGRDQRHSAGRRVHDRRALRRRCAARARRWPRFESGFDEIAKRRDVAVNAAPFYAANAAPCDPALQEAFAKAIAAHGIPVRHLPSGAGHDAMVFPAVAPTAMLFVRCGNNGISHHPDETMTAEDAEVATSVLLRLFRELRPQPCRPRESGTSDFPQRH